MAAVVEAFVDAVSDVVEAVGDVLEDVVELAEDVVDFVAENPLLLVAAIAAPYALGAFAAEAGVVGALEVATAAEAIEVGTAVLEATELATAVASAEVAAATTVIEAGATIAEATAAATAVAEGATVAEAVTVATGGAVEVSAIAEVATTAASEVASTSAWETLSQAAQNITTTIGETLAPGPTPPSKNHWSSCAKHRHQRRRFGKRFGKHLPVTWHRFSWLRGCKRHWLRPCWSRCRKRNQPTGAHWRCQPYWIGKR